MCPAGAFVLPHQLTGQLVEGELGLVQRQTVTGLDAADVEQIVDDPRQVQGHAVNMRGEFRLPLVIQRAPGALGKQFGIADHTG